MIENGLFGFGRNRGFLLGGALCCFPFNYRMLSVAKFGGADTLLGGQLNVAIALLALGVADIPLCIKQLKHLEKQIIKKSLPFLKIRQLPKTRMKVTNDRLINVPIPDDDVVKTVTSLPRTPQQDGLINLKLKRKMEYKSYHEIETVRPNLIYQALEYLQRNHPEYKEMKILPQSEYLLQTETAMEDGTDQNDLSQATVNSANEDSSSEEEMEEHADKSVFNSVTCLCPEDPTIDVVVNTSNKSVKRKTSKSSSTFYEIAPGEGLTCNNWARDPKFEINAFPHLCPDGQNHLHSKRDIELTPSQYFGQRILNHAGIHAEDEDYVFSAEQLVEKLQVEGQIDVSTRKGKLVDAGDEKKIINCESAFSIFRDLPGTPAYWRKFRNEMLARLEQLGPFDFFFTLSPAEMRWNEVLAAVLQKKGHKVTVQTIDGKEEYLVNDAGKDIPIDEYRKYRISNVTDLLKDHYVLITRMFDNRVKAFIKNILMKHQVKWYCYRIEFQVRGMPHVHGVFWLYEEEKNKYEVDGKYDKTTVIELIDKWVSCSLHTADEDLNRIIREVNVHHHTKSCKKYKKKNCRFNFPKFPSDETLIASPLPDTIPEAERNVKLKNTKAILEKVKKALIDLTDEEDNISLADFLRNIDVGYEDYKAALKISEKGEVVILKRKVDERFVNNYNPCFAKAWNGNSDLQFCMDMHAIVTYITDYFSKEDRGLTKMLKQAISEKKGCDDFERLNHVKKVYFTHRQKNLSEATYKLIPGLNLKQSNVKTTFVSTELPDKRSTFWRKCDDFAATEDPDSDDETDCREEEEDQTNAKEKITIQGRAGKFMKSISIHEKYAMRPGELNDICLAQFATIYQNCTAPKNIDFQNGISDKEGSVVMYGTDKMLPKFIQLDDDSYMKLRNSPLVLRIHS